MILVQMVMMTSLMNKREREREENHCVCGERERGSDTEKQRSNVALKKKYKKKGKKKDHAIFPFQTCSFLNVFKRLDASTNTNITFYGYMISRGD